MWKQVTNNGYGAAEPESVEWPVPNSPLKFEFAPIGDYYVAQTLDVLVRMLMLDSDPPKNAEVKESSGE